MAFEPLALHLIPWCFHVAGCDGAADPPSSKRSVRLQGADGRIRLYHLPIAAGDLMSTHPHHLLCRSDALVIGQLVPCLAPAEFLLPAHLFRPAAALSFASLAACLGDYLKRSGGAADRDPEDAVRQASGPRARRVPGAAGGRGSRGGEERRGRRVCPTEELAKDYRQLVRCRSWKPKLEMID